MQRDAPPELSRQTNADLLARRNAAVARGVGHTHQIFAARADNAEVWDVEGKRYIDFAGGIAVLNTGHRHPEVIAAVKAQLDLYTHTCFQVLAYEPYVELAERLNALAPGDFAKKTLLLSSGAEALENAVKIARAHTGRPGVICLHRRLPRPHDDDAGPDRQGRALQAGLRALPGQRVPCAVPERAVRREHRRGHRLGREHLQERHRGHAGGGHHHRAGAGRRRLLRGAGRLHAAPAQAVRPARHPADRRRGADRRRPHRHLLRDGADGRGRRHRDHGQEPGRRLPDLGRGRPRRGDGRARAGRAGRHLCRLAAGLRRGAGGAARCSRRTSCWSAAAPSASA